MKKTERILVLAAALLMGTVSGCGSKETSASATAPPTAANAAVADAAGSVPVTVAAESPEQAVGSFLNALQTGDDKAAAALLTTKARDETASHDMVVEPPGAPNATYTVGRVQHPDGNPDAAYVSCLWSEKFENGETESYEVVWVLRRESAGWRVAGMATQLADSEEPVFLDFEDLTAMENAVQKAEAPRSPQRADAQAQAPEANAVR